MHVSYAYVCRILGQKSFKGEGGGGGGGGVGGGV